MTTPPTSGLPIADWRQTLHAVAGLLAGRRWRLAGILALLAVVSASTLVLPITIGIIVDTVTSTDADGIPAAFGWQVAALVLAAVGGGVLEGVGVLALGHLVQQLAAELREQYVAAALWLPEEEIDRVGLGDIVTRAATDTRVLSDELPVILPTVVAAGFTAVMIVVGTSVIDVRFLLAFVIAIPLYVLALRWYLPAVPPVYAALRSADSIRGERVLTAVSALPTVVAFAAGEEQRDSIRAATWSVARWEVRARIMQNRFFGRINIAEIAGLVGMLACGFILAALFGVSLGQVTAAALLFLQLTGPLAALMFVMDDVQSAAAALARVVGVIGVAPEVQPLARRHVSDAQAPLLTIENVSYSYRPESPVLHSVSLQLQAGEHLAIVGSSGSGKTTLARLIAGVRHPDAGEISLSIDEGRVASLSQETHVFAATLGDNLRLAAPTASDSHLAETLRSVEATALLDLPGGLGAMLGEEGHRLTGAEAQLLALARLVLRDPALAILDEAAAEADSRTAHRLAGATAVALRGRAAIVIAHQLEQARACDRIIVLDHGRIVEEGTHEALLAAGGRYASVWRVVRPHDDP